MVMSESVVAQVCKTGESIPGKVCCSILVALHCCSNIVWGFLECHCVLYILHFLMHMNIDVII